MGGPAFTPGPWEAIADPHVEPGHADVARFRIGAQGGRQPIIDGWVLNDDDAHLIAAAPDMYEADQSAWAVLCILLDAGFIPDEHRAPVEQCRDNLTCALAKARGEPA